MSNYTEEQKKSFIELYNFADKEQYNVKTRYDLKQFIVKVNEECAAIHMNNDVPLLSISLSTEEIDKIPEGELSDAVSEVVRQVYLYVHDTLNIEW